MIGIFQTQQTIQTNLRGHRGRESHGSWPYNYLCNQCLSQLMLWVWISIRVRCTTSCDKFLSDFRQVSGFHQVHLQFWSKSDYPSWSSCPFFIKFIKMTKATIVNFFYQSYQVLLTDVVIINEGSNRQTHFWKRTIQWLFHKNFVLIEQMVSDKKIFMGISHRVLC
jgi:hypothetical protein